MHRKDATNNQQWFHSNGGLATCVIQSAQWYKYSTSSECCCGQIVDNIEYQVSTDILPPCLAQYVSSAKSSPGGLSWGAYYANQALASEQELIWWGMHYTSPSLNGGKSAKTVLFFNFHMEWGHHLHPVQLNNMVVSTFKRRDFTLFIHRLYGFFLLLREVKIYTLHTVR